MKRLLMLLTTFCLLLMTTALAETEAGWLRDRYELPLTHTGLIYSRKAAEKTAEFIETGGFRRAGA